jgi:hypothetical protein
MPELAVEGGAAIDFGVAPVLPGGVLGELLVGGDIPVDGTPFGEGVVDWASAGLAISIVAAAAVRNVLETISMESSFQFRGSPTCGRH